MRYHIIFRVCEDVYSLNTTLRNIPDRRPFGLDKTALIDCCFESLVQSLKSSNIPHELWVVGDRLTSQRIDFFKRFTTRLILGNFGNDDSLRKTYEIAATVPSGDWIYFCEDDYLHRNEAFSFIDDLILHRESYLGSLNKYDLFIYPPDYPDRYLQPDPMVGSISRNMIVHSRYCHWRQIPSTTFTFLCSSDSMKKFKNELEYCATGANDQALTRLVYSNSLCISPIPALSTHMHENAMSPVVDWNAVFAKDDGRTAPGRPEKTFIHPGKDNSRFSGPAIAPEFPNDEATLAMECPGETRTETGDSFHPLARPAAILRDCGKSNQDGEVQFLQGDPVSAEKTFLEILKSDPANVEAYNNLGVLEYSRNNPAAAIGHFNSALQIDPFHLDSVFNLADTLRSMGMLGDTLPYLEKVRDRYPDELGLRTLIEEAGTVSPSLQESAEKRSYPWKICYSPGIAHHGERFRRMLGLDPYVPSLHCTDPVWFLGMYFDGDYLQVLAHRGEKIINWRGSDTLRLGNNADRIRMIKSMKALHVCQSPRQQAVLHDLGIPSIVRPMLNRPVDQVSLSVFPGKETGILVFWRSGLDDFIRADLFFEIASLCPDVTFHIVGQEEPSRFNKPEMKNLVFHGFVDEERLDRIMDQCKGTIRPWVSDGTPNIQSIMLLKGRYAAHSCRFEKVAQCSTADDYVRWINELKEIREPNVEAREWWMKNLNNFDFLEPDFEPRLSARER
jgi:tetratricopeptide (TPR) repeat protein